MLRNYKNLLFTIFIVLAATVFVHAQGSDASTRNGHPSKEELPKGVLESLAKQRIDREKKDFDEMLERGEEVLKITGQLEKSFAEKNQFSAEDRKKLERLEKVVKKIRNEMGGGGDGGDDDEIAAQPLSTADALESLKNGTTNLLDELKKTSRYSVSVIAVQTSNTLLRVVQFLRFRSK